MRIANKRVVGYLKCAGFITPSMAVGVTDHVWYKADCSLDKSQIRECFDELRRFYMSRCD